MTTFQLDQNVNKKALARKCNAEAKAEVKRFPIEWKMYAGGFKDHQLLPIVMKGARPLITNDRAIAIDHANLIPDMNPGIIIVGHPIGHLRPLGRGEIDEIIAQFKARFPKWNEVCWSNSVVNITPITMEIRHISAGILELDFRSEYSDPTWISRAEAALEKNSSLSEL